MASPTTPAPFDPAAESRRLSKLFDDLSEKVDAFRLSLPADTPKEQLALLKGGAQSLEDQSHFFTAAAIGATLESIRDDLAQIKSVTAQAAEQLGVLTVVAKAIAIAGCAVDLGHAILGGDPGAILNAAEVLAKNVAG